MCGQRRAPPDYKLTPGKPECMRAREVVRITMGVSAGVGILIGYVYSQKVTIKVRH